MSYSSLNCAGVARVNEESHSFTYHTHVYLPLLPSRRASLNFWPVLIIHPAEDRRLSWPEWLLHTNAVYPRTVIHLSTNRARCRITSFCVPYAVSSKPNRQNIRVQCLGKEYGNMTVPTVFFKLLYLFVLLFLLPVW